MKICVYGASSNAIRAAYLEAGESLGRLMARRGHELVFGGGAQGMMGAVARGVTAGGGRSTGIAPSFFQVDGVLYEHCTDFLYTETMRQRKQAMEDRSDGFIMTPGGIGTYEEFFEILTLKQLGRHAKPIAVFNVAGYFDDLLRMLETTVREGFMERACLDLCRVFTEPEPLLDYLETDSRPVPSLDRLKRI